ncbi:hypothetical protein MRX96_037511 [Rhipicephalus microplus]|uniref:Putative serine protease inhibitor n=1 Tax=Rhipicephalus microplus TaxID=6941 RepID=A0A6M2D0D0_RHIMP|nr:PI-actitoxin-Afv2b-like [Rhipicephalus microplus]
MGAVYAFFTALMLLSIIASTSQAEPSRESPTCTYPQGCEDPVKIGPCRGSFPRFFYNTTAQMCQSYLWGGCSANCNNFENEKNCEKSCGPF